MVIPKQIKLPTGRNLTIQEYAHGVGRVDFHDMCDQPLGSTDYMGLCENVDTLVIDEVPKLSLE